MKAFFLLEYYYYPDTRSVSESSTAQIRIKPLIPELSKYGVECKVVKKPSPKTFNPLQRYLLPFSLPDLLKESIATERSSLFVSRSFYLGTVLYEKFWSAHKGKIVFDFDDALFVNPIFGRSCLFQRSIKHSSVVTVSSHYLLAYAKNYNKNVHLIHTPIDTDLFNPSIRHPSNKLTIGWMGNPRQHLRNLEALVPILMKLGQKYDIRFKMISAVGDSQVKKIFQPLEKHVEIDYGLNHFVPFQSLPKFISDFDIGISPLVNEVWFEAKSIIKSAMYMAVGLPTVASATGEQKYVINSAVDGFLAQTEDDWVKYLSILIEDKKIRETMGYAARKKAETELSVKACSKRLFKILESIA